MKEKVTASLDRLEREIEARYGCKGVAVKKEIVKATTGDRSLILPVRKFELIAHEAAKYCYAWFAPTGDGREKVVTMLESAPILSAEEAVWTRLNYEDGT